MAFSLKLFVMISLSTWTVATMVMARPSPLSSTTSNPTLATRLRLEDNNVCWETLLELQSCTGEVILFFLNGETYLGSGCCHALLNIAQECWPNMLTTLGLTPQEGDILRGYCDGAPSINQSLTPSVTTANASHPMSNNSLLTRSLPPLL